MKLKLLILGLFILLIKPCNTVHAQKGYKIDVTIHGIQDTSLILGYYFNNKMLVNDTIQLDSKGSGSFTGEEALKGGVYIIYISDKSFFDFIVDDEQHFSMEADNDNPVKTLKVKGNNQEKAFNSYQKFINSQQVKATSLQNSLKNNSETYPDSVDIWKKELSSINDEVNSYWDDIIQNHKNTFLSSFINAMKEVEIPDMNPEKNLPDSVVRWKNYEYYKMHYFDNIDMTDDRMLRTPFFTKKLETFFTKTIFQVPDSVIQESNRVIAMAKGNKEMEKYLIQFTFNMANESKIMGMDAAVVALGEKYYLSGYADWVDDEFITKLQERVDKMKPNLLGNTAPDLKLVSPNNEYYRLSEIYAPYTIVVFWEPDCGHCKKEIPILKKDVWDKYQKYGIKIFAVYTQHEKKPWTDFIEEKQLEEWYNVFDPYNQSNFRNLYDIYSTPVVYILDKDKKIVAKRIGVEQIPDFLDHELKIKK